MNRLNEIEARANAATEGPWEVKPYKGLAEDGDYVDSIVGSSQESIVYQLGCGCCDIGLEVAHPDAEFIAAARTNVPALVDALEKVLELHVRAECPTCGSRDGEGNEFHKCDDDAYCEECDLEGYPCPTVTAIRQHLGDDQ